MGGRYGVVGRRADRGGGGDDGVRVVLVRNGRDERRSGAAAGRWTGLWGIVFWLLLFGAAFVEGWN